MATPPVFLPGKLHEQRSLVGYSPWGHKESGTTEQLSMTTHMQISYNETQEYCTEWGGAELNLKLVKGFFAKIRSLDFVFLVMQKQQ